MPDNRSPVEIVTTSIDGREYISLKHRSNKPSVAILVTNDSKFLLLKIHRRLLGDEARLEIPRGFGELNSPIEDARRELEEETNLQAAHLEEIGRINADSGLIATPTVIFLATIKDSTFTPNAAEGIVDHIWCTKEEIDFLIRSGSLTDGFTIAAMKFHDSTEKKSETAKNLDVAVRNFFLSDTMDNMRHTEGKQLQLVIATIGAFVVVASGVLSTLSDPSNTLSPASSDHFLQPTGPDLAAAIGLAIWSTAAVSKLFRYRAWKEHYALKIREMTGSFHNSSVPVIYAPLQENEKNRTVNMKRRLLGDETLSAICLLLNFASALFVSLVLWIRNENADYDQAWKIAGAATIICALALFVWISKKTMQFEVTSQPHDSIKIAKVENS